MGGLLDKKVEFHVIAVVAQRQVPLNCPLGGLRLEPFQEDELKHLLHKPELFYSFLLVEIRLISPVYCKAK